MRDRRHYKERDSRRGHPHKEHYAAYSDQPLREPVRQDGPRRQPIYYPPESDGRYSRPPKQRPYHYRDDRPDQSAKWLNFLLRLKRRKMDWSDR